jgi:hypothetical protein
MLIEFIEASQSAFASLSLTLDHAYYAILMLLGPLIVWPVR